MTSSPLISLSIALKTSLLPLLTGLIAWLLTDWVRRNAVQMRLVQIPNHRSSHDLPTPHGGGLGIVLAGSLAGAWLIWGQSWEGLVIVGLGLVLAAVGLRDDIRHLPARVRFGVQLAVCGGLLWVLGDLPLAFTPAPLPGEEGLIGGGFVIAQIALKGLILLTGVWWINLFNFMDGIDGIAGSQAIFMSLTAAGLGAWFHPEVVGTAGWLWMLALAGATLGFLALNWPPARIFMGDVGSTYLAFMIFALALLSVRDGWLTFSFWLVIGAVFITDATVTLLRRVLAGERWFEAHCSHAYQRLSRRLDSHRAVTLSAIAVNMLWLAPLAWASALWPEWAVAWVGLAYLPLVIGAMALGAGRKDHA